MLRADNGYGYHLVTPYLFHHRRSERKINHEVVAVITILSYNLPIPGDLISCGHMIMIISSSTLGVPWSHVLSMDMVIPQWDLPRINDPIVYFTIMM